jgi:hypothetical protein
MVSLTCLEAQILGMELILFQRNGPMLTENIHGIRNRKDCLRNTQMIIMEVLTFQSLAIEIQDMKSRPLKSLEEHCIRICKENVNKAAPNLNSHSVIFLKMNITNLFNQLLLLMLLGLVSSCNSMDNDGYKTKLVDEAQNTNNTSVYSDSIFKRWVADTLNKLNSSKEEKFKSGWFAQKLVVGLDSLSLSIGKNFDSIDGSGKVNLPQDAINLLALLKEYEEYPKGMFTLKFKTTEFYAPSLRSGATYEVTYSIDSIYILEPDGVKSHYIYIRGRFSHKELTWLSSRNKELERIDFIWDNNELKKVKLK